MLDLKLTLGCMIFISYTIVSVFTRNFLKKMGVLVMTCEEYLSNMKPGYTVDGGSEEHLVMHELRHCLLFILFSFLLQHWQQGQVQESIC